MDKTIIKQLLRETFEVDSVEQIEEANTPKPVRKKLKAEYTEIRRALNKVGAPSQADIMQLAGLGKKGDKTDESLFSKKLRRAKNEEGGVYQWDDQERASIVKAINKAKK